MQYLVACDKLPNRLDVCDEASITASMHQDVAYKPQAEDILLGRGKSHLNHPGNVFFRGK